MPVEIEPSGVESVSVGYHHTLFVKEDGSLWAMGNNSLGQLGDGTSTDRHQPVKIMDNVAQACACYYFSIVVKTDGSLWGMGYNGARQLGIGSSSLGENSPVEIVDSGVVAAACGEANSYFIKDDGSLWGMGNNDWGQIGDGATEERDRPTLIRQQGTLAVAAGQYHAIFVYDTGEGPAPSSLLSPADNAELQTGRPTFEWTASNGAISYVLEVARNQNFTEIVFQKTGLTGTSYTSETDLLTGSYYWRVTASGQNGMAPPSQVFRFDRVRGVGLDEEETLPTHFEILGNYPNPFNPATTLRFQLSQTSPVGVEVFDLQGRLVMRLPQRNLHAGRHELSIDAGALSSGVYLYRITAGNDVGTGKMVLVK